MTLTGSCDPIWPISVKDLAWARGPLPRGPMVTWVHLKTTTPEPTQIEGYCAGPRRATDPQGSPKTRLPKPYGFIRLLTHCRFS